MCVNVVLKKLYCKLVLALLAIVVTIIQSCVLMASRRTVGPDRSRHFCIYQIDIKINFSYLF